LLWAAFAAAGGAVWALQFEAREMTVAPWVALVPLLLLLGAPRPGWLAYLYGWVYWMVAIPWIVPTLITFGGLPEALSWLLMGAAAAYLAVYMALFGALGARLWRDALAQAGPLPLATALVGLPALWVAIEWTRGWLFGGFPWNLAAYAWIAVPGALPLSGWIGPWGVSFLVVATATGIALGVARRRWRLAVAAVLVPLALLPFAGRFAAAGEVPHEPGQSVRLLQPNIANLLEYEPLPVLRNYQKLFDMSRAACDEPGTLLVWPESAAWPYRFPGDPHFESDVRGLVDQGCPLLFNSSVEIDGTWRNSAFLLSPGGGQARYDKRKLVPFGEYVPLRGVFTFIDTLAREAGQFTAAEELTLLDWGRERLGVAICFEITFPGEVAEAVRLGATSLVTITNDAWYGDTSAPWQHFRAVRFRAAENHRPLMRAAITGVSALVRPDGRVVAQLGIAEQGTLRGAIAGRSDLTPYARLPWLVPAIAVALALAAQVAARRLLFSKRPEEPR
jgi:apolipoprotein N-acyltransferase